MPQYPVPQFIESEGKIIFFLTFRQFFILVGGGALCVGLYFLTPFTVFIVGSLTIIVLTVAIAFFKVNNQSIITYLLHAIQFSTGTKNYTWKKENTFYASKIRPPAPEESAQEKKLAPAANAPTLLKSANSKLRSIQKTIELKGK